MPRLLLINLLLWLMVCPKAQDLDSSTLALLKGVDFKPKAQTLTRRPFLLTGTHTLQRYNPLKLIAASMMYFYQNVVSVQLNSNCPFHYSCSDFSKRCIARHGLIKGVFLTGDRLMRCSTFGLKDVSRIDVLPGKNKIYDEPEDYH